MRRPSSHLDPSLPTTLDRGKPVVERFGPLESELDNLENHAALLDFSHAECVILSGEERMSFLGGLITNQVARVTAEQSLYAAHLTPQGRFLWDFTLVGLPDRLLLLTEPGSAAPLAQRLDFYRLRAKIRIETGEAWALLGLAGPEAARAAGGIFPALPLDDAPLGATFQPEEGVRLWRDPRHAAFGWRLLVPAADLPAWWERLARTIPPAGCTARETHRIRKALPRGGSDLIPEVSLPLESGLLEMHGVDFNKGCYVGQETTARTHHRGTLKKRLHSLMLSAGDPVAPGTPILLPNGRETGVLTSIAFGGRIGLGVLHPDDVDPERPMTVGPLQVTAHKPEWAAW